MNNTLEKIMQINNSLDDMKTFNNLNKINTFPNYKNNYKDKIYLPLNKKNFSLFTNNVSKFNDNLSSNDYFSNNSPLYKVIEINKGIDSVYDNIALMKSNNKINSKVLYQLNSSSQTTEELNL